MVALTSGQTMAIGGLISSTQSSDISRIPLLGDLPAIGSLFHSKTFNKNETELIILLTPAIVNPESYAPPNSEPTPEMNSGLNELDKKVTLTQAANKTVVLS